MFARHQNVRRGSLMMQMDVFKKMTQSEGIDDDEASSDEEQGMDVATEEKVTIIVGEEKFITLASSLKNFPKSTLTVLYLKHRQNDTTSSPCILTFDRDPKLFYHILDAYEKKTVHIPKNVCVGQFRKELEFWKLKHTLVASCCRDSYMQAFEDIYQPDVLEFNVSQAAFVHQDGTGLSKLWCQQVIWEFLENPNFSKQAAWWSHLHTFMLLGSIFMPFMETNVMFRDFEPGFNKTKIYTSGASTYTTRMLIYSQRNVVIAWLELIYATFFTILLIVQAISTPQIKFFMSARFVFEVTYLTSSWTLIVTNYIDKSFWQRPDRMVGFQFVQLLSVLRFVRLFDLHRKYDSFRVLKLSLLTSSKEIYMLVIFIAVVTFAYGGMLYFTELFSMHTFGNAFMSMWCAIVTITTVGYGDFVPVTVLGRVVATLCALNGILVIGMPLPLITGNFYEYFEYIYCSCQGQPKVEQRILVDKLKRYNTSKQKQEK